MRKICLKYISLFCCSEDSYNHCLEYEGENVTLTITDTSGLVRLFTHLSLNFEKTSQTSCSVFVISLKLDKRNRKLKTNVISLEI